MLAVAPMFVLLLILWLIVALIHSSENPAVKQRTTAILWALTFVLVGWLLAWWLFGVPLISSDRVSSQAV